MSCKTYDPCLDGKLNQIGSYASVARQSAEASSASATQSANSATASATSAANSQNSANDSADSANEANNYLTQVENIFNDFDERYLGAKSVAPTLDNQGNPLQEGALYYNSTSNGLFVWNGTVWVSADFNQFTNFTATGTTFARNLVTREADVVNVKDFGAVPDGVTNNYTAILNAINYAATNGKTVYFPGPGTYNLSPAVTVPSNVKVNLASNTNVPRNNFIVNGIFYRDGISPEGDGDFWGRCFGYKTSSSKTSNAGQYNFAHIRIDKDEVSMVGAPGSKVNGLFVDHNFGGPNSSGGRHSLYGRLLHGYGGPATLGPPNPATTDRNYVGVVGQVLTDAWEGGTAGSAKGGFFGINAYAGASENSTYIFNLTSGEFNTSIATGDVNRVYYHSGIQIASYIGTRGTSVDAAISISNLVGPNGWKNGILMGAQNGRPALDTDSNAIKINSPHNTTIDITGIIVPNIIKSSTIQLIQNGNQNAIIELGNKSVANASAIRWYSDGTGVINHEIISNSAQLSIQTSLLTTRLLVPDQNNLHSLGIGSLRWTEVFAINGVINTSDGREKQQVRTITDQEKAVATKLKSLIRAYKWNDAVELKGENARIHFGVIAQDVKSAFEEEGLNADDYGIFCYDEWEAVEDEKDFEGNVIISGREAGNSYGVRYNELTMFILANL